MPSGLRSLKASAMASIFVPSPPTSVVRASSRPFQRSWLYIVASTAIMARLRVS